MFIRSLNRAPWAVKLVTVGAITVTAQAHDSRKRRDQHAKECGLLIGPTTGDFLMATDTITPATPSARPATTWQAAGQTARRQTRPNPPIPRHTPGLASS